MTSRPTDLPDYAHPPVTEVSLGVQFNTLEGLLAPHLGVIWNEFKATFPVVEQLAPLEPTFEVFGGAPSTPLPRLIFGAPTPRIFLINEKRTELLQVQKDRFFHNWRKIGEGDEYPRFERMLEIFENGIRRLNSLIGKEGLGSVVPNQCEVTYVNHIPVSRTMRTADVMDRVLGSWIKAPALAGLGAPEDERVQVRYIIRDSEEASIGRLIVTAEPAWKMDGTQVLQFTLSARGKPKGESIEDVCEFLKLGRRLVVNGFDELTTKEMHKEWSRK